MKKVLCILTLLCAVCTGAWADPVKVTGNSNGAITEGWYLVQVGTNGNGYGNYHSSYSGEYICGDNTKQSGWGLYLTSNYTDNLNYVYVTKSNNSFQMEFLHGTSNAWKIGYNCKYDDSNKNLTITPSTVDENNDQRKIWGNGNQRWMGWYLDNRHSVGSTSNGQNVADYDNCSWTFYSVPENEVPICISALQNKIDDILHKDGGIMHQSIGYPKSTSSSVLSLMSYAEAFGNTVTADNYDDASQALSNLYKETDINLPTPGKAYRIAVNGATGKKWYLPVSGNPVTDVANAATFVCGKDNNKYLFVLSNDSKYLTYNGVRNGTYDSRWNSFTIGSLSAKSSAGFNTTYPASARLGYVFIESSGRNANQANTEGCLVLSESGGWSAADDPFFNGSHTSAITFEEVPFPYTAKTLNAGGDGKYYATVALPYAMAIPEDVKAYVASAKDNVLTLQEVTTIDHNVPAGAYILVSDSETSASILPAAAAINSVVTLLSVQNELQGSITAAPSGDIYVLNKVDGVGFYKFNGDYNTLLGKAYLPSSSATVSKFSFNFGEETTAISAVESERSNAEIYDISGRKITCTQKGINIINGHKVIK